MNTHKSPWNKKHVVGLPTLLSPSLHGQQPEVMQVQWCLEGYLFPTLLQAKERTLGDMELPRCLVPRCNEACLLHETVESPKYDTFTKLCTWSLNDMDKEHTFYPQLNNVETFPSCAAIFIIVNIVYNPHTQICSKRMETKFLSHPNSKVYLKGFKTWLICDVEYYALKHHWATSWDPFLSLIGTCQAPIAGLSWDVLRTSASVPAWTRTRWPGTA